MKDNRNILVAGHRGCRAKCPENTLVSFQKALEIGVDMIEFDLRLTKDKKIVVIHDAKVDRTTNGTGLVCEFTLEELKELDAGEWFSEEFRGQRVPLLEELLETASIKKDLLYNVEIKDKTHEIVDLTIEMLQKYGVLDRCFINCFDAGILKYTKKNYNFMRCHGFPSFLMKNFEEGEEGTNSLLYCVGVDLKYLTTELVDFYKSKNIEVWPYPINTEEGAITAIEMGGTAVTSDDPAVPLKVFKELGYHK